MAGRLGWEQPPAVWMAVLGLALIVLPTLLSRLVGVAPEALRAVAFGLLAFGTVVEYVVWTIGLGAAAMTGLGRWATAPPPLPAPAAPCRRRSLTTRPLAALSGSALPAPRVECRRARPPRRCAGRGRRTRRAERVRDRACC